MQAPEVIVPSQVPVAIAPEVEVVLSQVEEPEVVVTAWLEGLWH